MPTALSWTDLRVAVGDLRALLRFRTAGLGEQGHRRLWWALALVVGSTAGVLAAAVWLPIGEREHAGQVLALLPSAMLGFLVLTLVASTASGGGRELVPLDQAVAYPISTATQSLGALLMAPLNIAWLLQVWILLGSTAYALGPHRLWATELPVLAWVVTATVAAQAAGWLLEGLRRGVHGLLVFRVLTGLLAVALTVLVVTDRLSPLLDRTPTRLVLFTSTAAAGDRWQRWALGLAALLALALLLLYVGCLATDWALGRPEREELRLESGRVRRRPPPRSPLRAMARLDRASVWRSVPLRRGIVVLAVMPGAVALAGALQWQMLMILPGLVASGGALLFGVNAWCLDGRGAIWRDSLPVAPGLAFWSRALVLGEVLLAAALVTSLMGALRAGRPSGTELTALVCTIVVVTLQVVGACLRWSVHRPFASDMRSARATPAPPVVMVGYSARLAWTTTLTAMFFSVLSLQPDWALTALAAVPLACWSAYRLRGTARAWEVPELRAGVVRTVSG